MVGAQGPSKFRNVCRALWGTHRSWPGGRGGRPRALIPGEGVREGLAWRGKAGWVFTAGLVDGGQGGGGWGGGVQGLRFWGVSGRGTGTHHSWPGGRGGRPRALVAGEGWGGGAWQFQRRGRVGAWLAVPGKGSGKGWLGGRGECKGFGCGGVGGRGTGPRDGANFATCVVFLLFLTRTKRIKMAFFEAALWGGGGVPTGAGLVDGGVDQGRVGLAERAPPTELAWWTGGQGGGARGRGGGARASVRGGRW